MEKKNFGFSRRRGYFFFFMVRNDYPQQWVFEGSVLEDQVSQLEFFRLNLIFQSVVEYSIAKQNRNDKCSSMVSLVSLLSRWVMKRSMVLVVHASRREPSRTRLDTEYEVEDHYIDKPEDWKSILVGYLLDFLMLSHSLHARCFFFCMPPARLD